MLKFGRKEKEQKHQTIMNELQKLEDKAHSHLGTIKQKTIDLIQNAELFFGDGVEDSEQLGAYLYEIGICLEIYDISMKIDIGLIKELEDILEFMQTPEEESLEKISDGIKKVVKPTPTGGPSFKSTNARM